MGTSTTELPIVSIRSTKGCWTCRLRKKKCDEVRPGCLRCASVNIECHYGPKPTWIGDSTLGKEELKRVKVLVGVTASRKRSEHRARARQTAAAFASNPSPSSPNFVSVSLAKNGITNAQCVLENPVYVEPALENMSPSLEDAQPTTWLSTWVKDQEASLIMHYLDHVFFIQFRFYNPSISSGGRGWLMSLLTRTKPLYHAAMSLSAFHRQSLITLEQGNEETSHLDELQLRHSSTLNELQLFISANSTNSAFDRNVQILACVVQLISFELFHGGVCNWQMHLRAAADLVLMLHDMNMQAQAATKGYQLGHSVQSPEQSALKFFTGCVVWFDMLSCVSTGKQAHLAEHHTRILLGSTPELGHNVELHTICGARNWVMVLISEIASLAAQKTDWQRVIDDNDQSLEASARDIELRLLSQSRETREELDVIRQQYGGAPPHSSPDIYGKHSVLLVTNIFASAAIIYLHSVITGSAVSPSLRQFALRESIESMRMVPDPRMFRVLVWPLCIAGCMASSKAEQDFFRDAATGAVNDSRGFGNSGKGLEILERSWLLQDEQGSLVDCAATIKHLGTCVLLC